MVLADSNIWFALAISSHTSHQLVLAWFLRQKQPKSIAFCRATQQSFLRLLTTKAALAPFGVPPLSNRSAWTTYERFLADARIGWVEEPRGLDRQWKKLTNGAHPSPKLWMDGYLAAWPVAGGHQFVTMDKAFKQFKGLGLILLRSA